MLAQVDAANNANHFACADALVTGDLYITASVLNYGLARLNHGISDSLHHHSTPLPCFLSTHFYSLLLTFTRSVRSLAPICSKTTSTMFSKPCLEQTHTARLRLFKRKGYYVGCLGTSWLFMEQHTSVHCHAGQGRQGSVVSDWKLCWSQILGEYSMII